MQTIYLQTSKKIKTIKLLATGAFFITFFYFLLNNSIIIPSQANSSGNVSSNNTLPQNTLVLNDPEKPNSPFAGEKGLVPFDHNQHISKRANITCVSCHHTNSKSLSASVEEPISKCSSCHLQDDSNCVVEGTNEDKSFKGKLAINSKDAYHGTGTPNESGCISCHKKLDIAPIGCNECHTNDKQVTYVIQPLFPTIKLELINQNAQTNNNTDWQNQPHGATYSPNYSYGYSYQRPYYPAQNTYSPQNTTPSSDKVQLSVNNYLPNNAPTSQLQELPAQQVIVQTPANYDYLLEDHPSKESSKAVEIEPQASQPLSQIEDHDDIRPANLSSETKSESFTDQLISFLNKFLFLVVIILYLDIRRRLTN